MPTSVLPSILRTLVPILVGYFAAWPVATILGLSDDQVTSLITAVITALYYLVIRALEQWLPEFGWLIGWASPPRYLPPAHAAMGYQLLIDPQTMTQRHTRR